jgi:small acid-soluble spore protein A (major alpha-type SASP)
MARGSSSNRALVREAGPALDHFKYETAAEIGVNPPPDGYWGDLPARQCGAVGGHMVRKMIEIAEQSLAGRSGGARMR